MKTRQVAPTVIIENDDARPDPTARWQEADRLTWTRKGGFVLERSFRKPKRLTATQAAVEFFRIYANHDATGVDTAVPLLRALRAQAKA
jgi:hypothetical protein